MLAVTAACLLVSREKFERIGGFFEGIAVSYNDVDLCFRLYEHGLYNVQCNDVILYHHESLSRGDDTLSEEKWERLLREKDLLYKRHPKLKGYDPFYSMSLAGHFSDYICGYEYPYERRGVYTEHIKRCKTKLDGWGNDCLIVNVEHAKMEPRIDLVRDTEKDAYWIEGWNYVLDMDNVRYKRVLILHNEITDVFYEVELMERYRSDVEAILPEQIHVQLAGFVCRIPQGTLPAGTYRIGMLAKDCCSRQKLYRMTDHTVCMEAPFDTGILKVNSVES